MPVTYSLIASNTLTSSAASVTFSSIPNTYTDLVVKASIRSNFAAAQRSLFARLNGDTTSLYSATSIIGDGASASSSSWTATTLGIDGGNANAGTSTSNSFSSYEFYLPSYLATQNKPVSSITAYEQNSATAYLTGSAGLYRSTSAITSLTFYVNSGNLDSGSSFFLYGIKNS